MDTEALRLSQSGDIEHELRHGTEPILMPAAWFIRVLELDGSADPLGE
jgi:hypothetical protein